jgi:mono/diheme cytochrome c family protein
MRYGALASFLLLWNTACGSAQTSPPHQVAHDQQSFEVIERGRSLAIAADCMACHTEAGGARFSGGRAIETPFGLLLTPNLTPDPETGVGDWSDDEFVAAVREGKGRGRGHYLYPAMPYPYYTRMPRTDVLAIRAYLNTLEPVRHAVNPNQLPFPFNIRLSMIAWNALFFRPGVFEPVPGKAVEWQRGAYLVEGPGHCGACHTAKNFLGGDKGDQALRGGLLQGWFSPDLTGNPRTGVGGWTVEDIVAYLETGHNRHAAATGPMAEVIADSTSHMPATDLRAMAIYLKDLPPREETPAPLAPSEPVMRSGEALYVDHCAACHVGTGTGVADLFPPLKSSAMVQSSDPTTLLQIVLHGTQNVATDLAPTGPAMPAFGWKLSDDQIADLLTYMRNAWDNAASRVSANAVKSLRAQKPSAQITINPP